MVTTNINELDADRFFEIYVKLKQNDRLIPYESSYYNYIINNIDESILSNWSRYLHKKADEISPDDFCDWYDELTFDTIDYKDIEKYHLPESIIEIPISNDINFVYAAHKILSDWYDNCIVTTKDMANVAITFNSTIIAAKYDFFTGYNREVFNTVSESFKIALKALQAEVKKFNEDQGKHGVHIECVHIARAKDSSTKAFTNKNGKIIKSELARDISISLEDLFYSYNKQPAEYEYVKNFFNIIHDEREKGLTNIEDIAFEDFDNIKHMNKKPKIKN